MNKYSRIPTYVFFCGARKAQKYFSLSQKLQRLLQTWLCGVKVSCWVIIICSSHINIADRGIFCLISCFSPPKIPLYWTANNTPKTFNTKYTLCLYSYEKKKSRILSQCPLAERNALLLNFRTNTGIIEIDQFCNWFVVGSCHFLYPSDLMFDNPIVARAPDGVVIYHPNE